MGGSTTESAEAKAKRLAQHPDNIERNWVPANPGFERNVVTQRLRTSNYRPNP
jgi:hypothetical protein